MSSLAATTTSAAGHRIETLTFDMAKTMDASDLEGVFASTSQLVLSQLGKMVTLVPIVGGVVGSLFAACGSVYATAAIAKHNKANCKLAAERCRAIAVIIQNCAHEYANASDGTKYVSNLEQLLKHVNEMKAMVEKYSTFSKLRQFVHSASFHDVYNRINVKISQVLQLISADLGTLAVHQNTEILNAMRFNEMLESMDLLQRKTDDNEANRSQMEVLLREKLHETATHLEKQDMKFQALKLLMEKNDSLATEKAETRARKLQKEMIRLMDQITAAGLREQKNANMVLAGQQWIKNVLRQRNSEKEAEQLIEAAMLRNEIDPERIQFLNANGPLAHSSQGEVHLVEFGGDKCAAKVISTAGMTPPEQTKLYKSFQTEFALMCSIKHPRVVRVYGASFFKDPSRLVLVMEHATKGSLRAMLDARNTPLSAEGANALAFDIACGMEALYEKGIHHRNLNAGNVLLDEHHRAKICDFGLSKAEKLHTHISIAKQATLIASVVAWMAPERLQGQATGDDDDEKCDVYSFGMTLWEIMTGNVPWKGLSEDQMKAKIANGERPEAGDISSFNALADVMERCLDQDPESRPTFSDIIRLISPHRKASLELELERKKSQEQERLLESRIAEIVSRTVSAEKEILKNEFQAKLRLKEEEQRTLAPKLEALAAKYNSTDSPTTIISAVKNENEEDVALLLMDQSANVNACGDDQITALQLASQKGNATIMRHILSHPSTDPNKKDTSGKTAMHHASINGHFDCLALLLASELVAIDAKDQDGWTALHYAVKSRNAKIVELFVKDGKVDPSPFALDGTTPLHLAVLEGDVKIVQRLIRTPYVVVNAKTKKGHTALHYAAQHNRLEVAELLLGVSTIDVNSKAKYGYTPLICASQAGNFEMLKLLLKNPDIDVNPISTNNETLLHYAAKKGYTKLVKLLLAQPWIEVNAANAHGTTPLHSASKDGHTACVSLLLNQKSIEVNPRDEHNNTPLFYARRKKDVIALLEAKGGQQ